MSTGSKSYVCPGESYPISRTIHLARMAAYYPKCRDCPFRQDAGQLAPRRLADEQCADGNGNGNAVGGAKNLPAGRRSLFTADGVCGRHLNELDRPAVRNIAAAFASLLWERAGEAEPRSRPSVVVGYDERPSSPDLVAGVIEALKRMGCRVIDVGPTMPPHFRRQAADLQATGGVLVTGAGCDPSWNGLRFHGVAAEIDVAEIERRSHRPVSRPTRSAGGFATVRDWTPYERSIRDAFHALRPLHVVVGAATAIAGRFVERLFADLPCRLTYVRLPVRARNVSHPDDADVRRLGRAVREADGRLGFLIDDDAEGCALLDERGELVSGEQVLQLLTDAPMDAAESVVVVVDGPGRFAFRHSKKGDDDDDGDASAGNRRVDCDAFITLAHVLAALSCSDRECSERLQQLHGG